MRNLDEDALLCDFAQYYHVYDLRTLPVTTAASLAQGLPEESRIVRRMSGARAGLDSLLLAAVADRLAHLIWMLSEDGRLGQNRPQSVLEVLVGRPEQETDGYADAEDFTAAWASITGGNDGN